MLRNKIITRFLLIPLLLLCSFRHDAYSRSDELAYTLIKLTTPMVGDGIPLQIKDAHIKNYELSSMANLNFSVINPSTVELQAIKVSLYRFDHHGKITGKASWNLGLDLQGSEPKEIEIDLKAIIKKRENVMMTIDRLETSNGCWTVNERLWPAIARALLHKKAYNLPKGTFTNHCQQQRKNS